MGSLSSSKELGTNVLEIQCVMFANHDKKTFSLDLGHSKCVFV